MELTAELGYTTLAQRLVILVPVLNAIRRLVCGMSMGAFVGSVMHFTVGYRGRGANQRHASKREPTPRRVSPLLSSHPPVTMLATS
jgi:hypothetical protein